MRQRRFAMALFSGVLIGGATMLSAVSAHAATPSKGIVSAATHSPIRGNSQWKLVFKDDFNQPAVNKAWDVYTVGGSSNPNTEWFSSKHVTVSGGQLHINGYVDRSVKPDGRIVTGGLGLWQRPTRYGKYEMLVRMPSCAQVKYAWMLWPYSNAWPKDGEIDFAEDNGGSRQTTTASLSYAGSNGQRETLPQNVARPLGGFGAWHILGVEWTPRSVRYTMDGHYWGTTKTTHIPSTPMVFVMQTEGLAAPGHVTQTGSCNADIGWAAQWQYEG